jgi:hypothetical protein
MLTPRRSTLRTKRFYQGDVARIAFARAGRSRLARGTWSCADGLTRRSAGSHDAVSNGADVRLLHDRRSCPISQNWAWRGQIENEFYVRAL